MKRTWKRWAQLGAALLGSGAISACQPAAGEPVWAVAGGHPERGPAAFHKYGCGTCHTIPGVSGADAMVGPPLMAWGRRSYIAGKMPNTPEQLIAWITAPQLLEPGTAMPNMGVTDQEARDMAAYLYTLR